MDALLAHKGIYRFTDTDEAEDHSYSYCFTDAMIQQRMIVLLEHHAEPLMDEEEEGLEEFGDDEYDDDNYADEEEQDNEERDEAEANLMELMESEEEYETSIAVLYLTDKVTYRFQLYHSAEPVMAPLVVYRIILDAIETISLSDEKTLITNLTYIATGVSTAEELENKEWRNNSYNITVDKVNTALRLYSEHKAGKK